ncbi:MAG: hypothetical protein PHR43_00385 [Dehalococcoidales bacterium]|nr:hypothetical protein [Dehalococcoidales bacterium]
MLRNPFHFQRPRFKKKKRNSGRGKEIPSTAFNRVKKYFKNEHRGYYAVDEEQKTVRMKLQGDRVYELVCGIVDMETVKMTVTRIITIPEAKMTAACVLANIINLHSIATFAIKPVPTGGENRAEPGEQARVEITAGGSDAGGIRIFKGGGSVRGVQGELMVTVDILGKCTGITAKALRAAYLHAFREATNYYPAFEQVVCSDVIPEDAFCGVKESSLLNVEEAKVPYSRVKPASPD